jgi:hypothetical protein
LGERKLGKFKLQELKQYFLLLHNLDLILKCGGNLWEEVHGMKADESQRVVKEKSKESAQGKDHLNSSVFEHKLPKIVGIRTMCVFPIISKLVCIQFLNLSARVFPKREETITFVFVRSIYVESSFTLKTIFFWTWTRGNLICR